MEENSGFPPTPPPPPPPVAQATPTTAAPPPIFVSPAPVPKARTGRGWMIFALILLVLLGISFLMNLGNLARGFFPTATPRYTHTVGPRLEEVMVEDNDSSQKIAVIEIDGIISSQMSDQGGFNMVDVIKAEFKRAAEDNRVRAVILKVNSPGGEVLASDEISRAISDFQKKHRKPVVASMGDLAASGGYYISAPCRWIVANELTLTGSIGVIMSTWNYRGLMNKVGVRPEVFKSGKFKDMLSPTKEPESITPEERQMIQALVDDTYSKFKKVVASGRQHASELNSGSAIQGQKLSSDWTDYADGRVLSGKEAYKLGFVDELGTFEDAVKTAKAIALVSSADIVKYQQRYELADFLRLFGKSDAHTVKVDLGVEPPKLLTGQLYFLSPALLR